MSDAGRRTDSAPDDEELRRLRDSFASRGLVHHARWMDLELSGYAPTPTAASLPELLHGAPASIIGAVSRARIRRGRVRAADDGSIVTWPHFFVEPIHVLRDLSDRIGAVSGEILVDIAPGHGEPATLAFTGNVVLDVLERIGLEIRDAARMAA